MSRVARTGVEQGEAARANANPAPYALAAGGRESKLEVRDAGKDEEEGGGEEEITGIGLRLLPGSILALNSKVEAMGGRDELLRLVNDDEDNDCLLFDRRRLLISTDLVLIIIFGRGGVKGGEGRTPRRDSPIRIATELDKKGRVGPKPCPKALPTAAEVTPRIVRVEARPREKLSA